MRTNHLNRWIMLLLAALMVLSIALGRQGYRIARTQDAVTDTILHDYAQLIADNYGRAMQTRIGFERVYQLLRELGAADLLQTGLDGWSAVEANMLAEKTLGLPLQAAFYFPQTTPTDNGASYTGLYGQSAEAGRLAHHWWTESNEGFVHPFQVLHWNQNNQAQTLVLAPATNGPDIIGLVLNPAVFASLAEAISTDHLLLPSALADSDAIRPFVHLQVKDTAGNNLFSTAAYRGNSTTATQIISGDYAGLFAGYTISATIERQAAGLFAFGAHPRADLSGIAILLLLTLVLGGAALLLLRRERKLILMRGDFVARVSHELRTPLTQIRMYAESLLFERLPARSDQTRALQVIQRETTRLGHLVENILRFSGGNGPTTTLENQPYTLHTLLHQLRDDFTPMLSARQTTLTIACDNTITSLCHRESVFQILGNLLDNALKYGPIGQALKLSVTRDNNVIHICLDDQGPGIPKRYQRRIFEPYFRLKGERSRAIAGTGIGLSVAADLARQMGGGLAVESLASTGSHGSRFCLTLPAA